MKDLLVPRPRKCRALKGAFAPRERAHLLLPAGPHDRQAAMIAACVLRDVLAAELGARLEIGVAFGEGAQPPDSIELRIGERCPAHPEGYRLSVRAEGVVAEARSTAGLRHVLATLVQLARWGGKQGLPCVEIEDWPRLEVRGFMLDISRGKVPTLETLFGLVDDLAAFKYNHLQLYCEHTFQYHRHPAIGAGHSPMTAGEVVRLEEYARQRHIELVPNLQSFGHQHHILKLPQYAHLAESDYRNGWTLSPERPETYELLADLYAEYLPLFRSEWLNISCDETWDLGTGLTRPRAERIGVARVYFEHILKLRDLAARHGRRIMMWGDIVQKHPEIVPEIPKDILMLDWFYNPATAEARRMRSAGNRLFREAGLETINCPGTNTWVTLACRTEMARSNIRWFSGLAEKNGARGMLLTDWGDDGHMNLQGFSLYPLAIGADAAWHGGADDSPEFDRAFSYLCFADAEGRVARALRLLDQAQARCTGAGFRQSGPRDYLLGEFGPSRLRGADPKALASPAKTSLNDIETSMAEAAEARDYLQATRGAAPPRLLDLEEHVYSAESMLHGFRRARLCRMLAGLDGPHRNFRPKRECLALRGDIERLAIELKRLWLARCKPSDLAENLRRFRKVRNGYTIWARKR